METYNSAVTFLLVIAHVAWANDMSPRTRKVVRFIFAFVALVIVIGRLMAVPE